MPKPTLVHYHIFKNAGTSVDRLLAESIGEAWAGYEGQRRDAGRSTAVVPRVGSTRSVRFR